MNFRSRAKRLAAPTALLALVIVLVSSSTAWAADPTGAQLGADPGGLSRGELSLNLLWIVIAAVLVIFMQAGFALVETGFTRAKHAAHVVSTNFAIFGLGFVAFFLVGYPLMFGGYSYPGYFGYDTPIGSALLGSGHWVFAWKGPLALSGGAYDVAVLAFFLYMVAFMDTTATIPTGAMAERWKWNSFIVWGLFCGALFYPLFGAWTWGGGWLNQLGNSIGAGFGYVDFAGSGVVHAMGGIAALAGAAVLGPRIGKFGRDGKPRTIAGHSIPLALLGTFILLVGWFGFNAGSTLAATDVRFTVVAANTAIAASFGAVVAMLWAMRRMGKPDPGMMANGMLAGLVAITAPCAFVQPWAAAVIGCIAGILVIESIWVVERRWKIDDPVGAISVHGTCGIWGVLAVGIFADGTYGQGWNLTDTARTAGHGVTGILYDVGLGAQQLLAQAIGVATIVLVMGGIVYAFFRIQNALTRGGIRPSANVELGGLDVPEMGVAAYPELEGVIRSADGGVPPTNGSGDGRVTIPEPASTPSGD
jgi:ammonium transporter, Amt family